MTICKLLKEAKLANGDTVSAWELTEKYETVPHYEVSVCRNSIELYSVKCAKTTWRKRFKEIVGNG